MNILFYINIYESLKSKIKIKKILGKIYIYKKMLDIFDYENYMFLKNYKL
jgi:hypothetical protein